MLFIPVSMDQGAAERDRVAAPLNLAPEPADKFERCRERGPLREDEARRFLQQLVIGLDYCHKMGVVNRSALVQACGTRPFAQTMPRP